MIFSGVYLDDNDDWSRSYSLLNFDSQPSLLGIFPSGFIQSGNSIKGFYLDHDPRPLKWFKMTPAASFVQWPANIIVDQLYQSPNNNISGSKTITTGFDLTRLLMLMHDYMPQ